jgi:exonuclease VII large subunit
MKGILMKRNLIFALLAAMLLPTFAACADTTTEDAGTVGAAAADGSTAETVVEEPEPDKYDLAKEKFSAIAAADFAGADFGIAAQAATGDSEKEIWVEELTGDAVNDAVYNRNLSVNERFNCNITLTPGDVNSIIRQAVQAGDGTYKLAFPNMATAASMAQVGLLMDYNKLENLNLRINALKRAICANTEKRIDRARAEMSELGTKLVALNPMAALSRGYSAVENSEGKIVSSVKDIGVGDNIKIIMSDGKVDATVQSLENKKRRGRKNV